MKQMEIPFSRVPRPDEAIVNKQLVKIRPLLAHEQPLWEKISAFLRNRQGWDHSEINWLKYRLSNEIDGFKRFHDSEILKIHSR